MSDELLSVQDLAVTFGRGRHAKKVIDGVSFDLTAGETVSLVGESGSGKTTIGRAVLGLAPVTGGRILFRGRDIAHATRRERRDISRDIQVIFQDPYSSLNPSMTIAATLVEPLRAAGVYNGRSRVDELLDAVGLPKGSGDRYPREFSGGQRQRIAIARAVAMKPAVIICDEPTSALDVTTQARVLDLLRDLQNDTGVAYLFISHDLGVVHAISDRIAVLRGGQIVELGEAHDVATAPQHPYTRRLQMSAPVADPARQRARRAARLAAQT
jgi:peptide/nickel transport system ATP-binding protein